MLKSGNDRPSTSERLELINPAIGRQGKKEMTVSDYVRSDEAPLLHHLIVHGPCGARGACQGKRTDLELIRAGRLPAPAAPVAVNPRSELAVGAERNRVLRTVVGRQRRVIAALELHELP